MRGIACCLSLLAMLVVAVPSSAGEDGLTIARLTSLRAASLGANLLAKQQELGLPPETGFEILSQVMDSDGRTHARFQQTYKGVPVWKARALGHMASDGSVQAFQTSLAAGIALDVTPSMTASQVQTRVESDLGSRMTHRLMPTTASLVVVPTSMLNGLQFKRESKTGRWVLDEDFSAPVRIQKGSYVLAYYVKANFFEAGTGLHSTHYLVDANSGAKLQAWDALRYAEVTGAGSSQYSGTVALSTVSNTGGTYALTDATRPTLVHPLASTYSEFNVIGNQTMYIDSDYYIYPYSDSDDAWGDGSNYTGASLTSANGQTAAVDAHYGAQVTWDMYKNVFGRSGIDGKGTSIASAVHYGSKYANAFWNSDYFMMFYGDGDGDGTGGTFKVMTALDVAAHEMSHGVMDHTAGLDYIGEAGGLNEANSDILGTMAEFYARGGGYASSSSTIPDSGGNWTIAEDLSSEPLRYMYKPSLDGYSHDSWFGGVGTDDVHYSSGIGNRFFYFLSQGTGTGDYASSFLSSGMTGVGNQKAAKIWYTAMRDYVSSTSADYAAVRTATLTAASVLYGGTSSEYQAVANAWAAVNVGAAYGGADPVRIQFTNDFLSNGVWGDSTFVLLPLGATFTFGVSVTNTTNTSVAWSTGATGPLLQSATYRVPCSITSSGVLSTPSSLGSSYAYSYGYDQVKAVSSADSSQYAATLVMVFNCDADGSGSVDVFDMATLAQNYGKSVTAGSNGDLTGNGVVNDYDVAVFGQAFQNVYGQ